MMGFIYEGSRKLKPAALWQTTSLRKPTKWNIITWWNWSWNTTSSKVWKSAAPSDLILNIFIHDLGKEKVNSKKDKPVDKKSLQPKQRPTMSGLFSPWGTQMERDLIRELKRDVTGYTKNQVWQVI